MTTLLLVPSAWECSQLSPPTDAGVELSLCGVGLVSAGLHAARRLAAGDVRRCVLVGLAGTRDPDRAAPGALVEGLVARNEGIGAGCGAGFIALGSMGLKGEDLPPDEFALARADVPGAVTGVIGSVAAASGSPEEAAASHARDPEVLVEEMEAYAVAMVCERNRVPLTVLRAVSNIAGHRDWAEWDLDGAIAALDAGLAALFGSGGKR
ncbi:MAG: 5'-methylthioadenosine/S-adenosylhomocysteine nucleosidase family protein [Planctomycetota bacterium]